MEKGNLNKILHNKESLKILHAIEDLKVDIEKAKFEDGESTEEVGKWGSTIEQPTDKPDVEICNLACNLEEAVKRAEDCKCEKEETLLTQQQKEELKFEKPKLKQRAKCNWQSKQPQSQLTKAT